MQKNVHKAIVILGPTASGKSDLAVVIAKRFGGEVISADSRQVYCGLDLGSGKITKREMMSVSHHLLDVASPKRTFTAARYQTLAQKALRAIIRRGRLPVVCGGTGFYIKNLVNDLVLPNVPPNLKLRKELVKLTTEQLFAHLKKLDSKFAKQIDANNPRRLIRAIEITTALGKVPPLVSQNNNGVEWLQIGIKTDQAKLRTRIHDRILTRIKKGMIKEVANLRAGGLSWQKLDNFGLEYRFISRYLRKLITKSEMLEQLERTILDYAKRQMTWFRKDKRIVWVTKPEQAIKLAKKFLKEKLAPDNKRRGD